MDGSALTASYRLIGELLLHPEYRDRARINADRDRLHRAPAGVRDAISRFLTHPVAWSPDEYVQTIELAPPCPLYLGAYLFDEPTTCRGAGTSGRNAYMLELTGIYRHFGFDLSGRELSDYLPIIVDFLWVSLEHRERDAIGLRRRFIEHYVRPALSPLHEALTKYRSPYALLVSGLQATVEEDLRQMEDGPTWRPPAERSELRSRRLPVLSDTGRIGTIREETQP